MVKGLKGGFPIDILGMIIKKLIAYYYIQGDLFVTIPKDKIFQLLFVPFERIFSRRN